MVEVDNNAKENLTANTNSETIDQDIKDVVDNDPDVLKLKSQEAELMSLFSDPKILKSYRAVRNDIYPKILKSYRAVRNDIYGIGERRQVSKKEKQKKKAKRRMAKKTKK